jgi:transcriptional regulator NrdR family protein
MAPLLYGWARNGDRKQVSRTRHVAQQRLRFTTFETKTVATNAAAKMTVDQENLKIIRYANPTSGTPVYQ